MWIDEPSGDCMLLLDDSVLRVDTRAAAVSPPLPLDEQRLADDVLAHLLDQVPWGRGASAGYGLLKRDWRVVVALRDAAEPPVEPEIAAVHGGELGAPSPRCQLAIGPVSIMAPFIDPSDVVADRLAAELAKVAAFRARLVDGELRTVPRDALGGVTRVLTSLFPRLGANVKVVVPAAAAAAVEHVLCDHVVWSVAAALPAPIAGLSSDGLNVCSALALVVPDAVAAPIEAIREKHDPAFQRWPPHCNFLFPFLLDSEISSPAVLAQLDGELARRVPRFRVTLARFDVFVASKTLFLHVDVEPRGAVELVYDTVAALFPHRVKARDFQAHVTVARGDDVPALEALAAQLRATWQPVEFSCAGISVLRREHDTRFVEHHSVALGAAEAEATVYRRFALGERGDAAPPPTCARLLHQPLTSAQLQAYRRLHRAALPAAPVAPLPAGVHAAHCVAAADGVSDVGVMLIGDVDSGKSSMAGRLVARLGGLPERVLREYERVCAQLQRPMALYSFIMDRLREERERSLTIEVHTWAIATPLRVIDLVDCPGHQKFIKNMSSGAALADAGLLLVSAAPAEFERGIALGSGMTRTEALMAYAHGVRDVVVAVNKLDLFDVAARQARFAEVSENIGRILRACGFDTAAHVRFVPVATFYGDNVCERSDAMLPWYDGPTVVEALEQLPTRAAAAAAARDDAPFRMAVMRTHRIAGVGLIVSGRVAQGVVRPRDRVRVEPSGVTGTVTTIERHHGQKAQAATGDIVGLALHGVKLSEIGRGYVLSSVAAPAVGIWRFTARVQVIRTPTGEADSELRVGARPFLFAHQNSFAARIAQTDVPLVKNARAVVVFETDERVVLEPFAIVPPLGRFAGTLGEAICFIGAVTAIDAAFEPGRKQERKPERRSAL